MNILYVASTCSREKYHEYVEKNGARVSQQAQKYNLLLAEGLAESGADVELISSRPINRTIQRKLWFKGEREEVNGVKYRYIPFVNYPILRNFFVFAGTFFGILFSTKKRKDTVVICDALNVSAALAVVTASFLRGYKTVGIVTDVPGHLSYSTKVSRNQKVNLSIMQQFKSFLLLTKYMSEFVNPKKRPFIVLEGHADSDMATVDNVLQNKYDKKVCLYAGSLMKIYGIENLVMGFIKADIPDAELHIYGNGDYEERLKELASLYSNVKYMGVASNSDIVKAEIKSTLLVNPRPTNEDYTKLSFPSKNMEYMASGTPVLTSRLPGMPDDHLPHVYLIDDESADGISYVLKEILSKDKEELFEKGRKAKEFILNEKSNVKQAEKVIEFAEQL